MKKAIRDSQKKLRVPASLIHHISLYRECIWNLLSTGHIVKGGLTLRSLKVFHHSPPPPPSISPFPSSSSTKNVFPLQKMCMCFTTFFRCPKRHNTRGYSIIMEERFDLFETPTHPPVRKNKNLANPHPYLLDPWSPFTKPLNFGKFNFLVHEI